MKVGLGLVENLDLFIYFVGFSIPSYTKIILLVIVGAYHMPLANKGTAIISKI